MNINKLLFSLFLLHSTITLAADEIHWTIMGQTSVTFDWRGTFIENNINYGTTPGIYNNSVDAFSPTPLPFSSLGPFWEAKITNLEENTRYYYSIGNGVEGTFKTPPPLGSSGFTIFAEGDIGDTVAYIQVAAIQKIIANAKPDFVVAVGDLSYGNAHGQAAVDQHFNDVMVWSLDAAYMPVWGNHEWDIEFNDDLRNYKGRFDLPNPQTSPDSPLISCCGEDWYWYDYGNVRFIALPEPWSGDWTDWNSHAIALMEEAQATQDITFIVTFVHRPAYSSAHHPGVRELKQVLDNLGDNFPKYVLNINGHSHNYERSHPQHGVVHITAGASGATLQSDGLCLWLICEQPTWSAFRTMHLGALKLDFSADSIKGTYICGPVGEGTTDIDCILGDMIDNFTIKISHPTDDASIKQDFPTNNYGSRKLEADNEPVERVLMKFNVPGVEGQSIKKAKLRLYNIDGSAKGGDFHHLLDNSWSESTVTWNNAPAAEQTIFASLDEVSSNNWYEVDLTSVINEEGTYSLEIASTSNNGADYHSKETQGFSPQLLVTYDDTIITPPFDITPPSIPTHLNSAVISDSQVNLFWSESTDNISVSGYHIYRDNIKTGTTPINSFSDTELTPSTSYTYTVSAFDEAGNTSSNSAITTATTPNETEPTLIYTPTDDASIKPDFPTKNYGSKKLETDNDPKEDFLIKFNISGTNGQSISNAKLRLYCINGSPQGGNLYIVKDNSWSESSITWDNAPAAEQFPLASLGPVSANNWHDINLTPLITSEGIYSFTISSTSRNGADYYSKETKEFAPQLILTFDDSTMDDVTPPSTPTDLTAMVISDTQVILSWSSSIDNKKISGYNIYQDDIHIGTTPVTSFSITGLASSTSYTYTVSAYDEAGNTSSNSAITTVTTQSTTPNETEPTIIYTPTDDASIKPNFPTKNYGSKKLETDNDPKENFLIKFNISGTNGQSISNAKLRLYCINGSPQGGTLYIVKDNSWSESSITWDNAPAAEQFPLASLGPVSANNWHDINLTPLITSEGIYSFTISSTSRNGADYYSKETKEFAPQLILTFDDSTMDDVTPPSTPTDLTAMVISDTQVILSWSSSIDNKKTSGYNIYQDDIHIGTTPVTSFSITGLAPSTNYTYTVSAYDEAGNTSSNSAITTVTTQSTTPNETEPTIIYTPTDDASIKPNFPTKNYGSKKLETDNDPKENFLIKFNISGTNGQSISNAKLRLYCINGSPQGGNLYIVKDNSWSESSITWDNAPAAEQFPLASLGPVSANNWHDINLTPLITSEGIYSFTISSTSRNGADYYSKETKEFAPQLILTFDDSTMDDVTPPSTPTDLTATVMSDTQIILSWSSSIDNKRISGYNIYQDDIHIGTTPVTSFSITGLAPSTNYTYTVSAYDEAGNTSSNSAIIIATTHSIAPTETEFTLTYTPTDDATIKPGFPIENYGSQKLETDSDPEEHILIKFNVSGTNGQAIASAKLFLYSINGSPKGGDFYHIIDNSWSESTVTWNNAPVAEPNLLVSLGAVSVNDWHEIDLTSLIRSEGIYSLRISSTSRNGTDYNSKEASNFKPQLIITLEDLLPEDLLIDD